MSLNSADREVRNEMFRPKNSRMALAVVAEVQLLIAGSDKPMLCSLRCARREFRKAAPSHGEVDTGGAVAWCCCLLSGLAVNFPSVADTCIHTSYHHLRVLQGSSRGPLLTHIGREVPKCYLTCVFWKSLRVSCSSTCISNSRIGEHKRAQLACASYEQ